ncbi:MAG: hypothetical protein FJX74_15365 [Armatimonadetes bacterium]|nr:hypothetical protein [Armatimonadota bacterium]
MRAGKSSEYIVAAELLRLGLDVYLPCVDDQAIDMLIRIAHPERPPRHYELQVKSVRGYNRIVGLSDLTSASEHSVLVLHYRHDRRPDEFFWLRRDEARALRIPESWGDLRFNKDEREKYADRTLEALAEALRAGA